MKGRKLLAALMVLALLTGTALAGGYVEGVGGDSNVRTGPGLSYKSIGTLYEGETLEYLGDISYDSRGVAWYEVAYGNRTGWVSSRYTALYDGYDIAVEATARVYVRTGPGLGYAEMGALVKGDRLDYLGSTSYDSRGVAWYEVAYGNRTGWVSSRYSELVYADAYVERYVEATAQVYIRSGPGLSYAERTAMRKGDVADYLNDYSVDKRGVTWYWVSFGGTTGWVSSRYSVLY